MTGVKNLLYEGDVQGQFIATLNLLLAAGADVNARVTDLESKTARIARPRSMSERKGQTALFGAVRFDWARVASYLIDHGAEVDAVDALGRRPLDLAEGRGPGGDNIDPLRPTVFAEVAELLRTQARRPDA